MKALLKDPHQCLIIISYWDGQEHYTVECNCGWQCLENPFETNIPWVTTSTMDAFEKWLIDHFKWTGSILIHLIQEGQDA